MSRAGVDVGGTFTDLVHIGNDGRLAIRKVLSTPDDPSAGLLAGLEWVGRREKGREQGTPVVHGTTVATNALLERRGARVVLVTTRGFEDVLWLRRQDRPALYDLARDHPPPLVERAAVIGCRERMGPDGVLELLEVAEIERIVGEVRARGPEAVAISLLFGFRHPAHERRLAEALRAALPGLPIAASSEVLPVFREYERTATTTAEAYLRPVVSGYVRRLAERIPSLRVMTSSGGTLAPEEAAEHAVALALSGPAGGVVGAGLAAAALGVASALTIDMGGTSADASVILDGAPLVERGLTVGGVPLALPAILIETVSAGGGSIAALDEGGALHVGPRSAGAVPGPACYGRGGAEPTVTDACLVLGWLDAEHPLAGTVHLDRAAAERALQPLARALKLDICRAAAGIVTVAAAVMARALKRVSIARGIDPRALALLPFGGAGPMFGCALADALGMSRVLVPAHPGVLSALGLAAAPDRSERTASCHRPLAGADLAGVFAPLVPVERDPPLARLADCRFAGQGYELTVAVPPDLDAATLAEAFRAAHRARYGHADPAAPIELVNVRTVSERPATIPALRAAGRATAPLGTRRITTRDGLACDAAIWPLGDIAPGFVIEGPAILAGADATALVDPGWRGAAHESGALLLERVP